MKKLIRATTDINSIKQNLINELYEFIRYDLWSIKDYENEEPIEGDFDVNGYTYIIKNDENGNVRVINPEGEEIYKFGMPRYIDNDRLDNVASVIINDAFAGSDELDVNNKIVNLNMRVDKNYGDGGQVVFGKYVDMLRNKYPEGSNKRYIACLLRSDFSTDFVVCKWFDDYNDAINYAEDFIERGANTKDYEQNEGTPTYSYTFKVNVIDTETGEELWYDKAMSKPIK